MLSEMFTVQVLASQKLTAQKGKKTIYPDQIFLIQGVIFKNKVTLTQ